jgi:RimJ/RimL family protein N-acetyltransferase
MLAVLQEAFGGWPQREITVPALAHMRWKLLARDDARPWHIVVEDDGRIVGLSAVFRQTIQLQGRRRHAYQLVDLAVLPEYENQGVTTAARRLAVRERIPRMGIYINSGARTEAQPKFRRTRRWDPVRRQDTQVSALVLEGAVTPQPAAGAPWSIKTAAHFDERVHAFAEQATQPFDFIDAHDEDWLNWRYCDPRAGRWTLHTAEANGTLLGYVTYRVSNGQGLVGGLLALPDRPDVVESLLRETMRSLSQLGVRSIRCWCAPGHPYQEILRSLGIARPRRTVTLTINASGEEFGYLQEQTARLHIVAGDTDLV